MRFSLYFFFLLLPILLSSQTALSKQLKGVIIECESGEPLIGASIHVPDTIIGTVSDLNGFFSLDVPSDTDYLRINYGGYRSPIVHLNGHTEVFLVLGGAEVYCLNEYGEHCSGAGPRIIFNRENLRQVFNQLSSFNSDAQSLDLSDMPIFNCRMPFGSLWMGPSPLDQLTRIKATDFQKGLVLHPLQAIKGLVPGLLISQAGNDPWATPDVRMQGFHTLLQQASPILLWDDMPLLPDAVIEPAMIKEMEAIRDPAQRSLWGLQGGSGAVALKADRPSYSKLNLRYQGQLSWQQATRLPEVFASEEYRQFSNGDNDFDGTTDWFAEVLRESLSQHHGLQLDGYSGQTQWQVDGHYRRANGVGRNTYFDQVVGHAKIRQYLWDSRLEISLEGQSGLRNGERDFRETFFQAAKFSPLAPVRFEEQPTDPELAAIFTESSLFFRNYFELSSFRGLDLFNPVAIQFGSALLERQSSNLVRLQGELALSKNWSVKASVGQQETNRREGEEHRTFAKFRGNPISGQRGMARRELTEQQLQYLAISSSLAQGFQNLRLKGTVGYRYQSLDWEYQATLGQGFDDDNFTFRNFEAFLDPAGNLESELYQENSRLVSFWGKLHLQWSQWLNWTTNYHYQGATRLGKNNRWTPYWGTHFELDFTRLAGISNSDVFKLHGSYGTSGVLPRDNTYQAGIFDEAVDDFVNPNPDQRGEQRQSWNFGFQGSMQNGRFFATFDYNHSRTTDLVVKIQQLDIFGNITDEGVNLEQVALTNRGWELGLGAQFGEEFHWQHQLLWSSYQVRLEELSFAGDPLYFDANGNRINRESFPSTIVDFIGIGVLSLDEQFGQILGRRLNRSVSLEEGKLVYEMPFPGGLPEPFDEVGVIGQALPQKSISWRSNLSWQSWRLGFLWRADLGHELANFLRLHLDPVQYLENNPFRPQNYWVTDLTLPGIAGQSPAFSDDYVENADYLSLDYVEIGHLWRLGKESNLEISLVAQNLLLWTNYTGIDPSPRLVDTGAAVNGNAPDLSEAGQLTPGIDRRYFYPRTRTLSLKAVLQW